MHINTLLTLLLAAAFAIVARAADCDTNLDSCLGDIHETERDCELKYDDCLAGRP